ncbi:IS1182-like element ISStau7 family transposase [Stigmatella aurantiaca]|uniref:Transposase, IS4-like protein n=1 Tax=Stigmatella aurantiaca (strain DW4/3-1) TaxID=378806 RepID=E3FG97_STIAD|nr:IS1182-like element ISStau7 family transposase [Stigmatella aurantiaca]ADO70232.1 Transposase, IS4-like protein [Stigmatella aurantiaca DW4/3-1]
MERWKPEVKCSEREERLLKLAGRSRKLFVFLREHRHELFAEAFQAELEAMYRDSGQGDEPQPPALMCMGVLLQAYLQVSDAEAVRLSATDRCWRLVLGTLAQDDDKPAFSQGGLQQFRQRLIRHDMDRRLLERTVELAKETRAFDWKKLPKQLRVAVDSRPLEGAGRVEDTFNLLGHAGRKIAECMAVALETTVEEGCAQAGAPLLAASSIKAALDVDWNDSEQKAEALNRLCKQLDRLSAWVEKRRPKESEEAPLGRYIEALVQVKAQDLEPVPGGVRIRQGVAEDRRVSIEDAQMRHGRKSKSKRFNGFKQHLSTHLDSELVLACAVTPANRPEEEAAPQLQADMARIGFEPDELLIDRAYLNSTLVEHVVGRAGAIVCKPWKGAHGKPGLFGKRDFKINVRDGTITCPGGQVETFEPGQVVQFEPEVCGPCPLRAQCTHAATGRGRTVTMGEDEALQKKLRSLQETRTGRAKLRERVGVEHRLAHLSNRQGPRARYLGTRKNTFDLRRLCAVQNLETLARRSAANGGALTCSVL